MTAPQYAPWKKRKALFIGRWQPWHKGHEWLVDQKLRHRIPVLIAVRDMEPDEHNPLSSWQVVSMIKRRYRKEKHVDVILIPDIESVNYGRGVGYEINEHVPPDDVHGISATEIRRQVIAGESGWRELVDESLHEILELSLK